MSISLAVWLTFRALRWIGWLAFFGYTIAFLVDRNSHFNSFGQLYHSTEGALFGFALLAIFAGFFELMMRERAGFDRPNIGTLIPPQKQPVK